MMQTKATWQGVRSRGGWTPTRELGPAQRCCAGQRRAEAQQSVQDQEKQGHGGRIRASTVTPPGLQVAHAGASVQVGLGINTCADQPTGSLSQLALEDK